MSHPPVPPRRRRHLALGAVLVSATTAALGLAAPSAHAGTPTPGTLTSTSARPHDASGTSIAPFYSASGAVSLSTNAAGSNDGPVDRTIVKPAGATVRAAFLMAAGTGGSGYTPVDGDVTIDGTPRRLRRVHGRGQQHRVRQHPW